MLWWSKNCRQGVPPFLYTYHPAGPGLSPKHTIYAFIIYSQHLCYIFLVKRTKINKKRPGLAHSKRIVITDVATSFRLVAIC